MMIVGIHHRRPPRKVGQDLDASGAEAEPPGLRIVTAGRQSRVAQQVRHPWFLREQSAGFCDGGVEGRHRAHPAEFEGGYAAHARECQGATAQEDRPPIDHLA